MLGDGSASRYFTTNYFLSEAPSMSCRTAGRNYADRALARACTHFGAACDDVNAPADSTGLMNENQALQERLSPHALKAR